MREQLCFKVQKENVSNILEEKSFTKAKLWMIFGYMNGKEKENL